jgi:hypothetical protein
MTKTLDKTQGVEAFAGRAEDVLNEAAMAQLLDCEVVPVAFTRSRSTSGAFRAECRLKTGAPKAACFRACTQEV